MGLFRAWTWGMFFAEVGVHGCLDKWFWRSLAASNHLRRAFCQRSLDCIHPSICSEGLLA
jgi:hypothetical protein